MTSFKKLNRIREKSDLVHVRKAKILNYRSVVLLENYIPNRKWFLTLVRVHEDNQILLCAVLQKNHFASPIKEILDERRILKASMNERWIEIRLW